MSTWEALLSLLAYLAVHGLCCLGAMRAVRLEKGRWNVQEMERLAGGGEPSARHPEHRVPQAVTGYGPGERSPAVTAAPPAPQALVGADNPRCSAPTSSPRVRVHG